MSYPYPYANDNPSPSYDVQQQAREFNADQERMEAVAALSASTRFNADLKDVNFKLSRENLELVSAIEQIHQALLKGVPSAAEKLAYDALAKWGRS